MSAYRATSFSEQRFGTGDMVSLGINFYQGQTVSLPLSCFPAQGMSDEWYNRET